MITPLSSTGHAHSAPDMFPDCFFWVLEHTSSMSVWPWCTVRGILCLGVKADFVI